jgi:menaquinone-9 beta-reductase
MMWRKGKPAPAKQTSGLLSSALLAGRARAGVASGVALLGDAAGSADPITGGGITQALQAAELLATYVPVKLGTDEDWLWEFDGERHALLRDYEIMTRLVLWLSDHPPLARWALFGLSRCPSLFSHLLGVSGGMKRFWGLGKALGRAGAFASLGQPMKQLAGIEETARRPRHANCTKGCS